MKRVPLKRKKKLNRVSSKQKSRLERYYPIRNAFMEEYKVCQICRNFQATDLHHRKGRRGNLLFDTEWFMALCRTCHDWVHNNIKQAKEMGWLVPFWK